MIKANELRIGNWVMYSSLMQVNGHKIAECEDHPSRFEPIPLTEDWLLKFGFYKNIDTELFEKGGYQIDLSVLKCHFYLPDFGDWYKELEYVHQLQNLYFALTGEELIFKEYESKTD